MLTSRAVPRAAAAAARAHCALARAVRLFLAAALAAAPALCAPPAAALAQGMRAPSGGPGGEHTIYGEFKIDASKIEKDKAAAAAVPNSFILVLMTQGGKVIERRAAMNNSSYRFLGLRNGGYEIAVESGGLTVASLRVVLDSPRRVELRQDISLAWDAVGRAKSDPKKDLVSAAEYYERPAATRDAFERAAAAIKKKKFADAAPLLRQVVEADPKDHLAWAHLGSANASLNRTDEAVRAYEQALALRPDLLAASVNLGRLHLLGKSHAKAVEVLKAAAERRPDSADVQHLLGEAHLQTGNFDAAAAHLREALRLDPKGKADAHLRLAAIQDAAGSKDKAAAELEQFLAKRPDHPNRLQFEQYVRANKKN